VSNAHSRASNIDFTRHNHNRDHTAGHRLDACDPILNLVPTVDARICCGYGLILAVAEQTGQGGQPAVAAPEGGRKNK